MYLSYCAWQKLKNNGCVTPYSTPFGPHLYLQTPNSWEAPELVMNVDSDRLLFRSVAMDGKSHSELHFSICQMQLTVLIM